MILKSYLEKNTQTKKNTQLTEFKANLYYLCKILRWKFIFQSLFFSFSVHCSNVKRKSISCN